MCDVSPEGKKKVDWIDQNKIFPQGRFTQGSSGTNREYHFPSPHILHHMRIHAVPENFKRLILSSQVTEILYGTNNSNMD